MNSHSSLIGLEKPSPDIVSFIDHLMGRKKLPVPPLAEFLVDDSIIKQVTSEVLGREWVYRGNDHDSQAKYLDNVIAFWRELGYDYVRLELALPFSGKSTATQNTAGKEAGMRSWVDEKNGAITSWQDFDQYPFPDISQFDFFPFEYLSKLFPDGMGLIFSHGGGVFERTSWIFSMEQLCYCLVDTPDLVKAVADRVGGLEYQFYEHVRDCEHVAAVCPGDGRGCKSSTLISAH